MVIKEFLKPNEIILTYAGDLFTLWDRTRGEFRNSLVSFCLILILIYNFLSPNKKKIPLHVCITGFL